MPKKDFTSPGDLITDSTTRENAVIELLTSYGAAAAPETADLLRAIREPGDAVETLRTLQRLGAEFLPADLHAEISETTATIDAEGAGAPSLRRRIDGLLARANDALGVKIAEQSASLSAWLKSMGLLLDSDRMNRTLRLLWRCEASTGTQERLSAIEELLEARTCYESDRQTLMAGIQERIAASTGDPKEWENLKRGLRALSSLDPAEIAWARRALGLRRSGAPTGRKVEQLRESRTTVDALLEQLRIQTGPAGSGRNSGSARLRAEALQQGGLLLQVSSAESGDGSQSCLAALTSWEQTIRTMLETAASTPGRSSPQAPAAPEMILAEINRFLELNRNTDDPERAALVREAEGLQRILADASLTAREPYHEAVQRAADLVGLAREQQSAGIKVAEMDLRNAAGELSTCLERSAPHLPTERVVRARMLFEEVDGVATSRDPNRIESLNSAINEEVKDLGDLAEQIRKRRENRVEAERDSLRSEAADLIKVASVNDARRLKTLAAQCGRAGEERLLRLRQEMDRTRDAVGQSVRLSAGKVYFAATRWLEKKGQDPAVRRSKRGREISQLVEALSDAMEEDDLAALSECATDLRIVL